MNKKLTLVERLEKIYEFFNVGYENGFIGNDEPDVIVAFDHILGEFKQVLNEIFKQVLNEMKEEV
jgi:hypothetical protein